ncbi:MAG: DUF2723 domain-containing protein [Flavobacteriaceae bacterium]
MSSLNYNKYNNITGWIVFAIAIITYTLTLEPTVSYWDCGEYISTAVKLEVGHPPGAPLFQMLGAFFAMFTTDVTQIAKMVNFMSALASAFTILFLFWTITALAKKTIQKKGKDLKKSQIIAVLGSGVVGALAYTFSDSFWFSAVEAEVYAMSSFLMALLLWLGIRWEAEMDKPRGHKWLLLISFVVGLSFGVHILSLLVIPSVVFIYFFKKYKKITALNFIIANVVAILILAFVFKFLFPFTLKYFSVMELFFVNSIGLPFNSGSIIAALLLIAGFYYGLRYTRKNDLHTANLLTLCVLFIMIGFSSWLMLPIRANANTTINENNPSSARELLAYYNREQYGDANVFYDNFYTTVYNSEQAREEVDGEMVRKFVDDKPKYEKDKKTGKYVIVNINDYKKSIPDYGSSHKGFIPRMVDKSPGTIENYIAITRTMPRFKMKSKQDIHPYYLQSYDNLKSNYDGFMDKYESNEITRQEYMSFLKEFQDVLNVQKPSFSDNLKFMFEYQFGYMYGRYFMWNFAGRQDDIQGQLDNHGNWMSGISLIDNYRLGSQKNLPAEIKENKGRNVYYFLPLLLGIIGLLYQLQKDQKNFYLLLLFFAFTGLAVIFYTNPKPFEPRERDYAVVGSFYVFAIWIGFGVLSIFQLLKNYIKPKITAIAVSVVCLIAVPLLMANQNWDDHDRSNRYTAHLNAKAYLDSCQENAIMFTIGDNDTFPLWYLQEVEGYRTDIKLINTSLFATDWYIDQQKRKTYKADPIPSQLTHDQYRTGALDAAYKVVKDVQKFEVKDFNSGVSLDTTTGIASSEPKESRIDIKTFMHWLASKKKATYEDIASNGHQTKTYPTSKLRVQVDKQAVLDNGIVEAKDAHLIEPFIDLNIDNMALSKNRILMLDILANNNWERPIYFTGGAFADEEYLWLKDYLQYDGVAYKLVPIKTSSSKRNMLDMGRINTDVMYRNIKKFDWKNSNDPSIYVDVESRRNGLSFRNTLNRLAESLIEEKQFDKAEEILDLSVEKLPIKMYKHYSLAIGLIENYYKLNKKEKAQKIANELIDIFKDNTRYYASLNAYDKSLHYENTETDLLMYGSILRTVSLNDKAYADGLIDDALESIPFDVFYKEGIILSAIEGYYNVGKPEKAQAFTNSLITAYNTELTQFSESINNSQGMLEGQLDNIKPTIEFYQYVMAESEHKDTVFFNALKTGYQNAFNRLENAMQ